MSIKFIAGQEQIEFSRGGDYPMTQPIRLVQVMEKSASGISHVETFGVELNTRTINFNSIPEAEYQELIRFFVNVVDGMRLEFVFEDERQTRWNARFSDPTLNLSETSYKRFSGSVGLEVRQI